MSEKIGPYANFILDSKKAHRDDVRETMVMSFIAIHCVCRAVESDFRKSNKSRIPKSF